MCLTCPHWYQTKKSLDSSFCGNLLHATSILGFPTIVVLEDHQISSFHSDSSMTHTVDPPKVLKLLQHSLLKTVTCTEIMKYKNITWSEMYTHFWPTLAIHFVIISNEIKSVARHLTSTDKNNKSAIPWCRPNRFFADGCPCSCLGSGWHCMPYLPSTDWEALCYPVEKKNTVSIQSSWHLRQGQTVPKSLTSFRWKAAPRGEQTMHVREQTQLQQS